jgi:DNA-binding NarL/FixJ family response regulator
MILAGWLQRAKEFKLVSDYGNAESAVAHLPKEQPDIVLMDIKLSEQSGIDCVFRLKPVMPKTKFVMLTVYEDAENIFNALAAGASGYLLKQTPRLELFAAIKQIHSGGSPMTSYIARKIARYFHAPLSPAESGDPLTVPERELLQLFVQGYSHEEVADRLKIAVPVVHGHAHSIYDKLHALSRMQAAPSASAQNRAQPRVQLPSAI